MITKHIGEELIFSSTQATPIWYSLYFQEWNNLSSKVSIIWFIQKQRIERISIQVTTKSSHIESYLLTHSNPPLSTIIPLPHHSSNEMRSLPASSRIAEIQTNNQSFSSNTTVSIPPCKLASASLNQFSVCRWVLASRWIIPSKQATETTKYFIPSFLVVWFPVWNTRIQHSHSHYYTSYPLHIPYTPKSNEKLIVTFTLFSLQTIPLFYSSSQNTFHSIPFTHSLTHSFTHSLIHSLIQWIDLLIIEE